MRRQDRQIPRAEALAVPGEAQFGCLATVSPAGEPYVVAVNHVLKGSTLYIHSAPAGHKPENLRANPRACLTAVVDPVVPGERHTTRYRSAVAFCRARLLAGGEEWRQALAALLDKYASGSPACSGTDVAVIALDSEDRQSQPGRD